MSQLYISSCFCELASVSSPGAFACLLPAESVGSLSYLSTANSSYNDRLFLHRRYQLIRAWLFNVTNSKYSPTLRLLPPWEMICDHWSIWPMERSPERPLLGIQSVSRLSLSLHTPPLPKTHSPMWFPLITLSFCINLSEPIMRWKGPGLFKKKFVSVYYENNVFHCPIFIQAYNVLIMFHPPILSNHPPSPS